MKNIAELKATSIANLSETIEAINLRLIELKNNFIKRPTDTLQWYFTDIVELEFKLENLKVCKLHMVEQEWDEFIKGLQSNRNTILQQVLYLKRGSRSTSAAMNFVEDSQDNARKDLIAIFDRILKRAERFEIELEESVNY